MNFLNITTVILHLKSNHNTASLMQHTAKHMSQAIRKHDLQVF